MPNDTPPSKVEAAGLEYLVPPRRVQELFIPGQLAGLNDFISAINKHWSVGAKLKKDQQAKVIDEIFVGKLKPIPGQFRAEFLWVEKNNTRDIDNIIAAKKFIMDALQEMRIIKNDNRKYWVGWSERVITAAKDEKPGIYVKLIEE